jgi:hypothetical protein
MRDVASGSAVSALMRPAALSAHRKLPLAPYFAVDEELANAQSSNLEIVHAERVNSAAPDGQSTDGEPADGERANCCRTERERTQRHGADSCGAASYCEPCVGSGRLCLSMFVHVRSSGPLRRCSWRASPRILFFSLLLGMP